MDNVENKIIWVPNLKRLQKLVGAGSLWPGFSISGWKKDEW
jgi:hypothetical protein